MRYDLQRQIADSLGSLTAREKKIIRKRFGIGESTDHTLEEVGQDFRVTRERMRQIEAKALRKLRHPIRSKKMIVLQKRCKSEKGVSSLKIRSAGCRPGSRGPFVSAKGPQTIPARAWPCGSPSSQRRITWLRNSLRSDSPRQIVEFGVWTQPRAKRNKKETDLF